MRLEQREQDARVRLLQAFGLCLLVAQVAFEQTTLMSALRRRLGELSAWIFVDHSPGRLTILAWPSVLAGLTPRGDAHSTIRSNGEAASDVTSRATVEAASHGGDSTEQTRKQAVREEEHDQDQEEAEYPE